jgi:DNA repair protein RecO
MEEIRIQGLCLSTLSVGEADLVLTILSEDHGLVKIYGKGIRRPSRAAHQAICRPGCVADWLLRKGRGEMWSFADAETLYYPDALFGQWEQLHDVLSMFRAVCDSQWQGKPIPALYALTLTFMRQMEVSYHPALLPTFLLKLLVHDGLFPLPHACQVCDGNSSIWGWSEQTQGLLCSRHADPASDVKIRSEQLEQWETMAALRSFEAIREQSLEASQLELLQKIAGALTRHS